MTWVLTRPLEDAKPLADALGLDVVPCIERIDLPWPAWEPLLFITSPAAARRLASEWPSRPLKFATAYVAALSPATAQVLAKAGIHPHLTAPGGSVALAQAVRAAVSYSGILYPTSDVGLEQGEHHDAVRILEAVGPVRQQAVYLTRAPQHLEAALGPHAGGDFVFFSPSAVQNFVAAGGRAGRALCVGASTARAWREAKQPEPLLATTETVRKVLEENP
ncbi:MAG: uroporphyrinogen-III synthase [Archangiaceae bacterium]|nr:uroporphyrinogen-III synthase [Archangiaceae bacterium]